LLDLHLGEHTSEAILKSLCTDGNNAVRTILITGNRKSMEDSAEMKLLRGGVESVFYKPLPLDELFEKIETLLLK
jgi:DNA-binding response OmpR family regulator